MPPVDLVALASAAPPAAVVELMSAYLETAATLGKRTAEMHLALASDASNPAFAPEAVTGDDLATASGRALALPERTLASLESAIESGRLRALGRRARTRAAAARRPDDAGRAPGAGCLSRRHGEDSHPRRLPPRRRCCSPRAISTSRTSRATCPGRRPPCARSSRRCATLPVCCDRSATPRMPRSSRERAHAPEELGRTRTVGARWQTWTTASFLQQLLRDYANARAVVPADPDRSRIGCCGSSCSTVRCASSTAS